MGISPPPGLQKSPRLAWSHRYLVRLVALALTVNLCLVTAMISVDLWAYQCGGQTACAGERWWLAPLRWASMADHPGRRIVLGALFVVMVVAILGYLSFRTRVRFETVRPPMPEGEKMPAVHVSAAANREGLVDPSFWDGNRSARRLGRSHLAVAFAFISLLVVYTTRKSISQVGDDVTLGALAWVVFVTAVGTVLVSLVLLAFERPGGLIAPVIMWAAIACTLLSLMIAWVQPAYPTPYGHLSGMRLISNIAYGAIFTPVAALFLFTLADVLVRIRSHLDHGTFRWGAPFVAASLGVALLNAIMLGFLIWAARLLGAVAWEVETGLDELPTPAGQGAIAVFPVIGRAAPWLTLAPVVIVMVFVVWEAVALVASGLRRRTLEELAEEYAELDAQHPDPDPPLGVWYVSALDQVRRGNASAPLKPSRWLKGIARGRRLAGIGPRLGLPLTAMALLGISFLGLAQWKIWGRGEEAPAAAVSLGIAVVAFAPVAGFALLRWGWANPQARRWMGVLWDVGTFWPRSYHPLAPPSYAERAVPELQRRIWWLHDKGHPVLLVAHSQGAVLAAAALVQTQGQRAPDDSVSLVTFGSPVVKLYHWGFPAYFTADVVARLTPADGRARVVEWQNFHCLTDYIGGPVGRTEVDRALPDPPLSRHVFGQSPPRLGRHTGYWKDEAMWRRIDQQAASLGGDSLV